MFRKCTYWLSFAILTALLPSARATLVPLDSSWIGGLYTSASFVANTVPVASQTNGLANAQGYSISGSITVNPNSPYFGANPWVTFLWFLPIDLNAGVYAVSDYLNMSISDPNPSGAASLNYAAWTTELFPPGAGPALLTIAGGQPASCPLPSCTSFTSSTVGPSYAFRSGAFGLEAFFWGSLNNVAADEFVTFNIDVTTVIGDGTGPGIPYPTPVPEPAYAGILALGVALLFWLRKAAPQTRTDR